MLSLNQPGNVKWWKAHPHVDAGVVGGAEHVAAVLDGIGVVASASGSSRAHSKERRWWVRPCSAYSAKSSRYLVVNPLPSPDAGVCWLSRSQRDQSARGAAPSAWVDDAAVPT